MPISRKRRRRRTYGAAPPDVWRGADAVRLVPAAPGPPPDAAAADRRRRLDNVNRLLRRQAAAVFNDAAALRLLARLRSRTVVPTEDFDFAADGRALAKLTAANFCEVGANAVYCTAAGQRFIDNINEPAIGGNDYA